MDYTNTPTAELEQLIRQKDYDAICELANRCLRGAPDCQKDFDRAYRLFNKAAKAGVKSAYTGIGTMYREGLYFVKNDNIANEYFKKAGANNSVRDNSKGIDSPGITGLINEADEARESGAYDIAKQKCQKAIDIIDSIELGLVEYNGSEDTDMLKIDAYWVLAFTAFNEQDVSELEKYMGKNGVMALHPWGEYLVAAAHYNSRASENVLESDLNMLLTIEGNMNLSEAEKGDVYYMIAELVKGGYGRELGYERDKAYEYYKMSAGCGNKCADEQINNCNNGGY